MSGRSGQSRRFAKDRFFGGAAIAVMTMNLAAAQAKVSKSLVVYQDTPKGIQNCTGSALF